jgi:hypothetical protein
MQQQVQAPRVIEMEVAGVVSQAPEQNKATSKRHGTASRLSQQAGAKEAGVSYCSYTSLWQHCQHGHRL